ncbi:MAG: hypothetical protein GTO54_09650 [Nitrososphaeria archaeon]|nr:hypothetical protein [Nitrososphaeria archaeon]
MKYFDLYVRYMKESYDEFLEALREMGYSGVGIVFTEESIEDVREARKKASIHGLEFFSRYNVSASDQREFNRRISKFEGKVDILASERMPKTSRIIPKKISVISLEAATGSLIRKISSQIIPPLMEFNLKRFSKLFFESPADSERMLRMTLLSKLYEAPLIVSSGAEDSLDLRPPLQLLYAFLGLTRSKKISKKYISTLPRSLIPPS